MKRFILLFILFGFVFAQQPTEKFVTDFWTAKRYMAQKRYDDAYALYRRMFKDAERFGFSAEIKLLAAECAYKTGRYNEAINILENILEKDIPKDPRYRYLETQVKFSLGLCYFQIDENQRAQRFLDEAYEIGGQGIADYLIRKNFKSAFEHLVEFKYPVTRLFLARSLIQSKESEKFPEIRRILTNLTEVLPLEEVVDFSRGEMWFSSGDYSTARQLFKEFTSKYPKSPLINYAKYYLACCYLHEGETRYALDNLEGLLDPNKDRVLAAHAYFIRGEAYTKEDMEDSVVFSYENARAILSNTMVDFFATYRLYQLYKNKHKIDLAEREARNLGEIVTRDVEKRIQQDLANYVKGVTEFELNNYLQAVQDFDQVIALIPEEPNIIYEAALVMDLLTYNRLGNFGAKIAYATNYLRTLPPNFIDSIPKENGGDWRAYLLYNLADAKYFASYGPSGRIINRKSREEARGIYQDIVTKYPSAFIAPLARISLAWYELESGFYDNALTEFLDIIETTAKTDALVLAAYGAGLCYFYKKDYLNAGSYFFTEKEYREQLRITPKKGTETLEIKYNELADSLIDDNIWYRGLCLEKLKAWGDALAMYEKLINEYPDRPRAGDASSKIVEFYILANKIKDAEARLEDIKARKATFPSVYRDSYGHALAVIYSYYRGIGDDAKAKEYAQRIRSELRTTRYLEEIYYTEGLKDTSITQIEHLKGVIDDLRGINENSEYLPQLMFNLSYLYMEDKQYEEAKNILIQLRTWPRMDIVKPIMAEILFQLGRAFYELKSYDDAIAQLKLFVRDHANPKREDTYRPDLAARGYYLLGYAQLSKAEMEKSPFTQRTYYRDAKKTFETLKKNFADDEFYNSVKEDVEKKIIYIKRKLS